MNYQNEHKKIPGKPSAVKSSSYKLNDRVKNSSLKLLTEDDWSFWITNGYVIIKKAIPKTQALATAKFLWEFEDKDPNNPETWYLKPRAKMQMKELIGTGMIEVYNHQTLWKYRQEKKIYNAFSDIWGTKKLWVSIDRANLNFPLNKYQENKGFIHWDYDPETKPINVQGVLALSDQTDKNMGGFQCVPKLYREYDSWKLSQPKDRNRFQPDISDLKNEIVKVPLLVGDLLIFNSLLPHGIRPNFSKNKIRIAQYISMFPAEEDNISMKDWRTNSWSKRIAPEGYAFPGDPRNWEQKKYGRAKLSLLGKKLLGLLAW